MLFITIVIMHGTIDVSIDLEIGRDLSIRIPCNEVNQRVLWGVVHNVRLVSESV